MTGVLEFNTNAEAWEWIKDRYPECSWELDVDASEKAGYKVFRDSNEYYNYVCDLGCRLEVNIKLGSRTYNLWIKSEMEPSTDEHNTVTVNLTMEQVLLVKGALCELSNNLNTIGVTSGKYNTVITSMECLKLVKMLNEVTNE